MFRFLHNQSGSLHFSVCTTELGRIAVHKEHFCKRNVKLLAHSVDDLHSHVDWVNVGLCIFFLLSLQNKKKYTHTN